MIIFIEMNNKVEYILCAAYKFKEGYRTPKMEEIKAKDGTMIEKIYHEPHREVFRMALGWRHADIIYKYADCIDQSDAGGFMTSKGRYVDRKEAAEIAYNAGQTEEKKSFLYSEDIY